MEKINITKSSCFVTPDTEWFKKCSAYRSLVEAGIPIPDELVKFFNGKVPDGRGKEIEAKPEIASVALDSNEYVVTINTKYIPKDAKFIDIIFSVKEENELR